MNFPGTTAAYLSVPSDTDFQFGTGNFTVEAWLRQTAAANYSTVLEIGNHLNASGIVFLAGNIATPYAAYSDGIFAGDGSARTLNAFEHIAWVRNGNSLLIYRNKTLLVTRTFTNNLSDTSHISIGFIASFVSPAYVYTGQMDELIVTKGVALQPDEFAFSAPVPDA
jgi:hypothetical protein